MPKVIVIGAGVMGASAAFRLAEAGADVLVLEANRVGGGTSGISFAWTNAHNKPPRPYHDLNVAGMKATSSAPHRGGTAAAAWNGSRKPIVPRRRPMSSACDPGAMPPSGSRRRSFTNWSRTLTLQPSATRRSRISPTRAGSIRCLTRMRC